jgi:hypothetical protein
MFRILFPNLAHAGFRFPGGAARRSMTRAASLAAISVLMLGTLSGAAVAQGILDGLRPPTGSGTVLQPVGDPNRPLRVYLTTLKCLKQSNDNTWPRPDHDEPYVLIFAADLRGTTARGAVFVTREFSDVDAGDSRSPMLRFWWLDGEADSPLGQPIRSINDYIFLAAVNESDFSGMSHHIRDELSSVLIPKLTAYKQAGMSRSTMVNNLRVDMDLAIRAAIDDYVSPTGDEGDEDDRVGGVQEIFFGANALQAAQAGSTVRRHCDFEGSGSRYTLTFQLQ